MATLKNIRDRMKTARSTIKITKTLRTISAARLRRARIVTEGGEHFLWHARKMLGIVKTLKHNNKKLKKLTVYNLIATKPKHDHHLYILFTSDRGLCGAFNNSLYRLLNTHVASDIKNDGKITIICIGKKGAEILLKQQEKGGQVYNTVLLEEKLHDTVVNIADLHILVDKIVTLHALENFNAVALCYNHFLSTMLQRPTVSWLHDMVATEVNENYHACDVSPTENIIEQAAGNALSAALWYALRHSITCEHAMRMKAMDNATQNGQNVMKQIIRDYNKKRQSMITSELIDIISGAEVQNII